MFITTNNNSGKRLWLKAKGNRKLYGKLLRERDKQVQEVQNEERLKNLRRMLAKGKITKEEFDEKTKKI